MSLCEGIINRTQRLTTPIIVKTDGCIKALRKHRRQRFRSRLQPELLFWVNPAPLPLGVGLRDTDNAKRLPCSSVACLNVKSTESKNLGRNLHNVVHREPVPTLIRTLFLQPWCILLAEPPKKLRIPASISTKTISCKKELKASR